MFDVSLLIKSVTNDKIGEAIEVLTKALTSHREESPFQAYRELEERTLSQVHEGLYKLFEGICRVWLKVDSKPYRLQKAKDSPYTLDGKTYINPKTGKPLGGREWRVIKEDLEKAFGHIFSNSPYLITRIATALGKILQSMDPKEATKASFRGVEEATKASLPTYYDNILLWANETTGEYITSLKANARKNIVATIVDAQRNQLSSSKLATNLLDNFADMNRDWRRIAETEMASNFSNGYLLSTIQQTEKEEKPVFMMGHSDTKACPWCKSHINGQVVVLMKDRPSDDGTITIDGKTYPVIWPGKTNVGLTQSLWWACIPAHPHCHCVWSRYIQGLEKEHQTILQSK
ncbi:MAG: hypothetical protein ACRDF4_07210 [Rhabdochlamydiaceae bacterium]